MKLLALVVALLLSSTLAATAQPAADATAERREKIKQRIRALRAYTLTEQLKLDEATAGKLFPALAKYDDELDKLLRARADVQRRLRDAGNKDAKAVDALIDEATANQRAIWDVETRRLERLRKILTPAQVARLLLVVPAMERKLQQQLRKIVETKQSARGGRAPAAPGRSEPTGVNPIDPFGDSNFNKPKGAKREAPEALEDPFSNERPRKAAPAPTPARKQGVCDPFTNPHGCK